LNSKTKYDITILTDSRYVDPKPEDINWYIQNILDEDNMVKDALSKRGLKVHRVNWDNTTYDWSDTAHVLFRTTWDYFDRFEEFSLWLEKVNKETVLINPMKTILWNMDKHYLLDLKKEGINTPPGIFIEKGDNRSLNSHFNEQVWDEAILKPAISGAGRHTYRLNENNVAKYEEIFKALIKEEAMLLQEYQQSITEKGEVAFMVFGGKFSHAILKKAKKGDFRVQDDFGGTVHDYNASEEEILFVEKVVSICKPMPLYARVDIMWDNNDDICVSELELIEPELWFRKSITAADLLAEAITNKIKC
jgi:glutathione synthase/RimK-type ligase-like ATP-grasp enzyme